jgi:hypothetical protein
MQNVQGKNTGDQYSKTKCGWVDDGRGQLAVVGKRPRGRPRRNWEDMVKDDMKTMHVSLNDVHDK